jgi:hypothetical protein
MSNDRLANLRDEIEGIMVDGPIGTWTNPPSTFPFSKETVAFHSDGTGRYCMATANYSKPLIEPFVWRMLERGRMYLAHSPDYLSGNGSSGMTMAFEMIVQGTEFGEELVMASAGKQIFEHFLLATALVREEPPLKLPRLSYRRQTRWSGVWTRVKGLRLKKIVRDLRAWLDPNQRREKAKR